MHTIFLDLVAAPANPVPPDAVLQAVTTRDRVQLRAATWTPATDESRGVVVILQGRGEFIEKYFETIADLRRRGFHVVAFDWRGQGGSRPLLRGRGPWRAKRVHIRSFDDYQRDLDAVLAQIVAPLGGPLFALGHSMGGAVALLRAARRHGGRPDFERIVAVSPMIALSPHTAPRFAGSLARIGAVMGLGRIALPHWRSTAAMQQQINHDSRARALSDQMESFDRSEFAQNQGSRPYPCFIETGIRSNGDIRLQRLRSVVERAPWIAAHRPTVGWLAAAHSAIRRLASPGFALRVATPALVMAAGSDMVASTPATERFAARLKAGNALVLPYARHDILMEDDDYREAFWAAFDAFIPGQGLIAAAGEPTDQRLSSASAAS